MNRDISYIQSRGSNPFLGNQGKGLNFSFGNKFLPIKNIVVKQNTSFW